MVRNPRFWMVASIIIFLLTRGAVKLNGSPAKPAPRIRTSHLSGSAKALRSTKAVSRKPNFIFVKFPALKGVPGPFGPLALQNRIADDLGLGRFEMDWMVILAVLDGRLVPVKITSPRLFVETGSGDSGAIYGYAFPEVIRYIEALPRRLPSVRRLKITSLVRSEEYQRLLTKRSFKQPPMIGGHKRRGLIANPKYNPNAVLCGKEGTEHCSPHLTGYAFDISVRGLSAKEIAAIGDVFSNDKKRGIVIPIYEPNMAHYHVMVTPPRP